MAGFSVTWLASRLSTIAQLAGVAYGARVELLELCSLLESPHPTAEEAHLVQHTEVATCEACGYCWHRYELEQNPCPRCNPQRPPPLRELRTDPSAHLGPGWLFNEVLGMGGRWVPRDDYELVSAGTWEGLREVWRPYADEAFKHMDGGAIHTIPEMVGVLVDYLVALGGGENGRRVVQMAETIERLKRERDVLKVRLEQAEARRPAPVRGR